MVASNGGTENKEFDMSPNEKVINSDLVDLQQEGHKSISININQYYMKLGEFLQLYVPKL